MARMEKGREEGLEVVVSYSYGLEARVNFYVEATHIVYIFKEGSRGSVALLHLWIQCV